MIKIYTSTHGRNRILLYRAIKFMAFVSLVVFVSFIAFGEETATILSGVSKANTIGIGGTEMITIEIVKSPDRSESGSKTDETDSIRHRSDSPDPDTVGAGDM